MVDIGEKIHMSQQNEKMDVKSKVKTNFTTISDPRALHKRELQPRDIVLWSGGGRGNSGVCI